MAYFDGWNFYSWIKFALPIKEIIFVDTYLFYFLLGLNKCIDKGMLTHTITNKKKWNGIKKKKKRGFSVISLWCLSQWLENSSWIMKFEFWLNYLSWKSNWVFMLSNIFKWVSPFYFGKYGELLSYNRLLLSWDWSEAWWLAS